MNPGAIAYENLGVSDSSLSFEAAMSEAEPSRVACTSLSAVNVISLIPCSVSEASEGDRWSFSLLREGDLSDFASVEWRIEAWSGVGVASPKDFDQPMGSLSGYSFGRVSFAPGQARADVSVPTLFDWQAAGSGRFSLVLENPVGATIGTSAAVTSMIGDARVEVSIGGGDAYGGDDSITHDGVDVYACAAESPTRKMSRVQNSTRSVYGAATLTP
ncbi:MAG: hypothetical protein JNL84_00965 [Candidatus Accumulibacter sp.]|nr:hypothetical protein [Accumulibacter sp.]